MKIIHWDKREPLHIETPLEIVNVRCGLIDSKGRHVDSIETIVSPDYDRNKVVRRGYANTKLIELKTRRQ